MSDKVRVYEIAEEVGASSSDVIQKARQLGIELKSPQSAVSNIDAEEIANFLITGESNKVIKKQKPNKPILIKTDLNKSNISTKKKLLTKKYSANKDAERLKNAFIKRNNDYQKIKNETNLPKNNNIQETNKENHNDNKKIEKHLPNLKRTDLILNSYPDVTIEIYNLKTIKYLKWNLHRENGVYAIIGENGSGKSSLLISIAKLIRPQIFHHELTGIGYYDKTEIIYTINNTKFKWIKNSTTNNNWRQSSEDKVNMPGKLKGFFESSILTGTRFNKVDQYIKDELEYRDDDTISSASSLIKDTMNYILFGNRKTMYKFDNLYKINAIRRKKETDKTTFIDKEYTYYALNLVDKEYIKEHLFSTGEYFLLQLLKFIDNFKNNGGTVIPALIIIDEVELSLHPLAQSRLIKELKKFAKQFKLIILFASHSLHILENISAKNTYFIQRNISNKHLISNPIHQGYLTSKLFKHQFFDKVILVEDTLAKLYIEHTINDLAHHTNIRVGVIIVGGSSQVVEAAIENFHEKFYGDAEVMVSLDEDMKKDAYGKQRYIKWNQHIPVPKNIENYIDSLVKDENHKFIKFIESIIIHSSYHDLNIQTTKQKTAFTTLVAEIAKNIIGRHYNNLENAKGHVQKELVSYVYNEFKNNEEQEKLAETITSLFEFDKNKTI